LAGGAWAEFYKPAEKAHEISLTRPFYPLRPGGTNKQQLLSGLRLGFFNEMLRACDRETAQRCKACEIFWTLGANQVGKAAIAGWRDLLAPALCEESIMIWPFAGDLTSLLESGKIVVAESYPAETYSHIGLPRSFGKRSCERRKDQSGMILDWCKSHRCHLQRELLLQVSRGFGETPAGEDAFDSFIGALGMIEFVENPAQFAAPADPCVQSVEGWILGMSANVGSLPSAEQPARRRPIIAASTDEAPPDSLSRLCPACQETVFKRWSWGWDGHAAHVCSGIEGATPEMRKRAFRERYLL